jgi:alpha-L-rhamnosidase
MKQWLDWIHNNNPNLLWQNERNNDYGDWLNGNTLKLEQFGYPAEGAEVPKELLATAFWQESTEMFSKMALAVGRKAEAEQYGKLAGAIRDAFVKAYIEDDGKIKGHTQAGYAMSLNFDLVPENLREAAVKHMIQRIEDYKWHISTGFHTTVMLMNQLTRFGRSDVAYRLINNKTMPSWGYEIEHGATTVWERWDGWVKDRGFQDAAMNSFNHYAIGAVGEWMYRTILGINPDEAKPGYKHFTIRPVPGGGLTYAKGSYHSIRGDIASAWKLDGDTFTLDVTIPPNTTATVYVPAGEKVEGGEAVRIENGTAVFEVGSGTYQFVSKKVKTAG